MHRLQRERGATAARVAGGGSNKDLRPCACGTGSLVADLRRRTDRVATSEIASELGTLREAADRAPTCPRECAAICFSMLAGYSKLIGSLLDPARLPGYGLLIALATLKEYYGQQRAFLVGVGNLPAGALTALPARAMVFILNTNEKLHSTHVQLQEDAARMRTCAAASLRTRLDGDTIIAIVYINIMDPKWLC